MIQHGSYLIADIESQPYIDRGEAVLYRGVQNAEIFLLRRLTTADIRCAVDEAFTPEAWRTPSPHSTPCIAMYRGPKRDGSMTGALCSATSAWRQASQPEPPIMSLLYSGYALEEWCAAGKFGPNYVKFRTPLSNIRITTFVCNETEVKIIDPNKLEVIEAVGCRIREVCIGTDGGRTPEFPTVSRCSQRTPNPLGRCLPTYLRTGVPPHVNQPRTRRGNAVANGWLSSSLW